MSRGYYECPHCGANLDPGEKCSCKTDQQKSFAEAMKTHQEEEKKKEARCA